MDQQTKFQKVLDILKEKGMSEEQISEFAANLTKTNFTRVYAEAMSVFNEEDLSAIDKATNQEQANQMIAERYKLKTGKDVIVEMQKFLDIFCDGFLKEVESEQAHT